MSQEKNNLGYLGNSYQFKLLYNLIWFPKFSKHILPYLTASYFSDYNYKQFFTLLKNYFEKYNSVPDRHKVEQLIQLHVELEMTQDILIEILNRLIAFSKALLNGDVENDSQHIQDTVQEFAEQQKLQHVATFLQEALDVGDRKRAREAYDLFQKAFQITDKQEPGVRMGVFRDNIIQPQYFDAIPTGIPQLDAVVGGLPKGKIGMFVAGQGVGKSSFLSLIANNAYLAGKRVLHVVFDENEIDEVERLHTARWAGIPTKLFPRYQDYIRRKYAEVHEKYKTGELVILRLSSDGTTVQDLRRHILSKQQDLGFEFDMAVIDYLEELSTVRTYQKDHEREIEIMRSLKSMTVDLNIALWTATQGTKFVNDEQWVLFKDIGGSVMKIKKAQLIVSGGVSLAQRKTNEVNFSLLKCNYAQSGHQWEACYFKRSVLDLRFTEVTSYVDPEDLKKGFDEEDESELMNLLTAEEIERLPEIDEKLKKDAEDAPDYVPFQPVRKLPSVVRENYTQPQKSPDEKKVEELKNFVGDIDFTDL